jgi:septal ring factor EnvC (AmiA/AmiB activator)
MAIPAKICLSTLLLVLACLSPPAGAADQHSVPQQNNPQSRIESYRERQKNLRREIEMGRQEVKMFTRKEAEVLARLNRVGQALNQSRLRAAALQKEIEALDGRILQSQEASQQLGQQIQANEMYVARRLVALYKMNWLGKFHLLASAGSMQEFIQRQSALERILARDEEMLQTLAQQQTTLRELLASLESDKARREERAEAYQVQIRSMSRDRSVRKRLLADIRSQKALELAAIEALSQAANDLDREIQSLGRRKALNNPEKNGVQLTFSAYKGLLIMPVKGRIVHLFGPYRNKKYNVTNFRSGIDIKAEKGEPIRAVFKGRVIYASWFKGYGNMIIIDHGKNYYTIYAHLEETFKSKGDTVETREVIATVGDTGSFEGAKLYFEVRHHGKPQNPLEWLKRG